ncbi:hypothetical protein [Burkholderia sp. SCN-KJ]|uniref:hypothetical protein n=1 Tax=Burkholderia sp. SCN-KJ TaxID=2969248 RepID=UPI00214FFE72|nr:hypothetical protein [Burkholderia sp. SCN-KJ]MCR4470450.1 hypothetical protein [Burkholderia sp. SCN-KJ]
MLTPALRGRVFSQHQTPLAVTANDDPRRRLADENADAVHARAGVLGDSKRPSAVSADVAGEKETSIVSPQDHVNDFLVNVAGRTFEESDGEAQAATPAKVESFPVSAKPQRNPAPLSFASVTSLDDLHGIEPIAEALLATLAAKARTGRLDELKALELLRQAVLLRVCGRPTLDF